MRPFLEILDFIKIIQMSLLTGGYISGLSLTCVFKYGDHYILYDGVNSCKIVI